MNTGRIRAAFMAAATLLAGCQTPPPTDTFACALDLQVSEAATPHLNMLLRRTLLDAGLATYGAYPSGRAAVGWAWALVLAEVAPERTDALVARGRAFGQSRVVCGYHWQSDVDAGREVGAAVVARLHADATSRAQLDHAKREVADARAAARPRPLACDAEAAALSIR